MIKSQTTLVKSSTIESLYYSTSDNNLMVTFIHGVTYTYFDVTLEDYLKLINTDSIGKALNETIKGKYKYEKHEELFWFYLLERWMEPLKKINMERFFNHKDLGKVEVLMSFQRTEDGKDLPKVIALVTSTMKPYVSEKWSNLGEITYKRSYNLKNGNVVSNYYLVWGTDYDFKDSGIQLLTTNSGRKVSFKSALKIFNDARKATEFLNFSKI